jgi:hypothetical protein
VRNFSLASEGQAARKTHRKISQQKHGRMASPQLGKKRRFD